MLNRGYEHGEQNHTMSTAESTRTDLRYIQLGVSSRTQHAWFSCWYSFAGANVDPILESCYELVSDTICLFIIDKKEAMPSWSIDYNSIYKIVVAYQRGWLVLRAMYCTAAFSPASTLNGWLLMLRAVDVLGSPAQSGATGLPPGSTRFKVRRSLVYRTED